MAAILEIIRAWKRAHNPNEEEMRIAEERLETCKGCEFMKEDFLGLGFSLCEKCLCPIDKKIFSSDKEGCPEKLWKV